MKRCPACGQQFTEDYSFCLDDGTVLVPAGFAITYESETPTVVARGETPTVVVTRPQAASAKRSVPFYVWLFPLLGLLAGTGMIAAFVIFRMLGSADSGNTIAKNTANGLDNRAVVTPSPSPAKSPSPRPTMAVTATPEPTLPPAPPPIALKSYPATTRLKFARGAVSTSYSGEINPGGRRSFALSCRYGQQLSASVLSAGNCITLGGGGTSYRSITSSGDNYVTVSNACSTVVSFRISITII